MPILEFLDVAGCCVAVVHKSLITENCAKIGESVAEGKLCG